MSKSTKRPAIWIAWGNDQRPFAFRHDADIRPERVADGFDAAKILLRIRASDIELHGAIALFFHEALAVGNHHLERLVDPATISVVGLDFFGSGAAEQLPQR